jgi:hypothetical protein
LLLQVLERTFCDLGFTTAFCSGINQYKENLVQSNGMKKKRRMMMMMMGMKKEIAP